MSTHICLGQIKEPLSSENKLLWPTPTLQTHPRLHHPLRQAPPATPPLSPTPTLDLNIIPEETDVNPPIEPAEDDSPLTHDQESINNNSPDSDDSDPGYGSIPYMGWKVLS